MGGRDCDRWVYYHDGAMGQWFVGDEGDIGTGGGYMFVEGSNAATPDAPAAAPPADAFVAAARSAAHSAARSAAAIAATMARLAAGRAGLHMPQMLRQTARRKALAKYPWPAGSQKNGRSGAGPGTPAGEAGTGTGHCAGPMRPAAPDGAQ